ncbi:hypothetical protein FGO68_gene15068 [Halteria grandinella]|uniref:Uncharacterized protein n=1 Tax=Halteria grandinella TaxID=5974 RepID=A0A8J8NLR7_HALGN|nr:hypothetical protein FGO68_gene15068 [Halteria grandinella]
MPQSCCLLIVIRMHPNWRSYFLEQVAYQFETHQWREFESVAAAFGCCAIINFGSRPQKAAINCVCRILQRNLSLVIEVQHYIPSKAPQVVSTTWEKSVVQHSFNYSMRCHIN